MHNLEVQFESYCPIPAHLENNLPTEYGYVDIERAALKAEVIIKFEWPVIPQIGSEIGSTILFREVIAVQHSITRIPRVQIYTKPIMYTPMEDWFLEASSLDEINDNLKRFTKYIDMGTVILSNSEIVNVANLEFVTHYKPELAAILKEQILTGLQSSYKYQKMRALRQAKD